MTQCMTGHKFHIIYPNDSMGVYVNKWNGSRMTSKWWNKMEIHANVAHVWKCIVIFHCLFFSSFYCSSFQPFLSRDNSLDPNFFHILSRMLSCAPPCYRRPQVVNHCSIVSRSTPTHFHKFILFYSISLCCKPFLLAFWNFLCVYHVDLHSSLFYRINEFKKWICWNLITKVDGFSWLFVELWWNYNSFYWINVWAVFIFGEIFLKILHSNWIFPQSQELLSFFLLILISAKIKSIILYYMLNAHMLAHIFCIYIHPWFSVPIFFFSNLWNFSCCKFFIEHLLSKIYSINLSTHFLLLVKWLFHMLHIES